MYLHTKICMGSYIAWRVALGGGVAVGAFQRGPPEPFRRPRAHGPSLSRVAQLASKSSLVVGEPME